MKLKDDETAKKLIESNYNGTYNEVKELIDQIKEGMYYVYDVFGYGKNQIGSLPFTKDDIGNQEKEFEIFKKAIKGEADILHKQYDTHLKIKINSVKSKLANKDDAELRAIFDASYNYNAEYEALRLDFSRKFTTKEDFKNLTIDVLVKDKKFYIEQMGKKLFTDITITEAYKNMPNIHNNAKGQYYAVPYKKDKDDNYIKDTEAPLELKQHNGSHWSCPLSDTANLHSFVSKMPEKQNGYSASELENILTSFEYHDSPYKIADLKNILKVLNPDDKTHDTKTDVVVFKEIKNVIKTLNTKNAQKYKTLQSEIEKMEKADYSKLKRQEAAVKKVGLSKQVEADALNDKDKKLISGSNASQNDIKNEEVETRILLNKHSKKTESKNLQTNAPSEGKNDNQNAKTMSKKQDNLLLKDLPQIEEEDKMEDSKKIKTLKDNSLKQEPDKEQTLKNNSIKIDSSNEAAITETKKKEVVKANWKKELQSSFDKFNDALKNVENKTTTLQNQQNVNQAKSIKNNDKKTEQNLVQGDANTIEENNITKQILGKNTLNLINEPTKVVQTEQNVSELQGSEVLLDSQLIRKIDQNNVLEDSKVSLTLFDDDFELSDDDEAVAGAEVFGGAEAKNNAMQKVEESNIIQTSNAKKILEQSVANVDIVKKENNLLQTQNNTNGSKIKNNISQQLQQQFQQPKELVKMANSLLDSKHVDYPYLEELFIFEEQIHKAKEDVKTKLNLDNGFANAAPAKSKLQSEGTATKNTENTQITNSKPKELEINKAAIQPRPKQDFDALLKRDAEAFANLMFAGIKDWNNVFNLSKNNIKAIVNFYKKNDDSVNVADFISDNSRIARRIEGDKAETIKLAFENLNKMFGENKTVKTESSVKLGM